MTENLKPCPFCGGEAKMIEAMNEAWVSCLNEDCRASSLMTPTSERAAEKWNTRAPVNEWQPIETAPRDGVPILLHGGNLSGEFYLNRRNKGCVIGFFADGKQYWICSNTDYYEVEIEHPTHWMPLPQPPKEKK